MTTSLKNVIGKSYYGLHHKIRRNEFSTFWLKGGRGSLKSSFAAVEIILGIIEDANANALVLRKVGDTLRTSVMSTLLWATEILDVEEYFDSTVSPAEIVYKPTGQKIILKGLDKANKLKSIKLKRGYFKFLWFEEAEEFNGMTEIRNVRQSARRGGNKFIEFITYNPPNDPAAWVNKEAEEEDPDRIIHHSTYLDAPPEWLGEQFLKDAEALKKRDPLAYEHEYMGIAVGRAEQIVFHGKWQELEFETPPPDQLYQNRYFYGGDWGFANDPTAFVRSFIKVENGQTNLYIDYEAGGVGVEMEEIAPLLQTIPGAKQWKIWADCSRPETISFVSRRGYNIEAAKKWEGSVEDGIEYIKGFDNIFVHPRCVKTIEELTKYSYKVDKNTQEILPVIVDKWNHYIDALRYSLWDYIKTNVSILDVI